jgi:choline dehydrogenase-like flavoprotein
MPPGAMPGSSTIVGAGSAGCVPRQPPVGRSRRDGAAARGRRQGQLLLDPHPGRLPLHRTTRAPTGATVDRGGAGLNGRALAYPRGRVLGGCSSINGMIYMRGQAARLRPLAPARQRRLGLGRRAALLPRSEDHYQGADDMHGAGGEWRVEEQRLSWEILDAFRDACAEAASRRRRLQSRRQRGLRLLPGEPAPRRALERPPRPSCARCATGRTSPCSPRPRPSGCVSTAGA